MNTLLKNIKDYPLAWFLIITFTITWGVWLTVPVLMGEGWVQQKFMVAAGFGPAPAALIVSYAQGYKIEFKTKRWLSWFLSAFILLLGINTSSMLYGDGISAESFSYSADLLNITTLTAALISSFICAFVIASVVCSTSERFNSLAKQVANYWYFFLALSLPLIWTSLGIITNVLLDVPFEWVSRGNLDTLLTLGYVARSILFTLLVVAVGEEVGWRGWMLPHLQRKFSPLFSTVIIGVVWGLWHWPLFIIGQYSDGSEMVFAKVGLCILLGTIFTWLYNRSGGSLLLMVLLHTALNNTGRILPMTASAGAYMLVLIVAMIFVDKMWKRDSRRLIS